jgi:hypothetical protein
VFYLDIPYVCNDFQTFLGVFLQVFQKHVSVSLCFFQVFQKHASVPDLEDLVKAEGTSDYDYTAIAIVCSTAHLKLINIAWRGNPMLDIAPI